MISVGILSYKRTDLLLLTLSDIVKTENEIEIILLNNNEDYCILNEVCSVISNNRKVKLKYLWDKKNYGVALGRRKLVEECSGRLLILFDDDVHIDDIDCIFSNCISLFQKDDLLGAIAFNIKEFQTHIHNRFEIPHKNKKIKMDEEFETYYVIGAGHAIDIQKARFVGNYPKDFGLYGFEEIDLSFRLINAGFKIKYSPYCVIYHKRSPDGRFSNKFTNQLAFINRTRMAKRYFKRKYFVSCFLIRSIFLILKTRDLKLYISAVRQIHEDDKTEMFGDSFYKYVKNVNGFLYW